MYVLLPASGYLVFQVHALSHLLAAGFAWRMGWQHVLAWYGCTWATIVLLSTQSWTWFVYAWEVLGILAFFLINDRIARGAVLWGAVGGGALMLVPFVETGVVQDGLVLFAILTKSAQWPFDRWLQQVAVAPNYISAFLHGVTAVQAGLILLLRLEPDGALLCRGLVVGGVVTAMKCFAEHRGKLLVVAVTQVFIGCNLAGYGLGLLSAEEAWSAMWAHALYKPLLFFLADLSPLGWGCAVACAACGLIHCSSLVWLPCAILYWRLLSRLWEAECVPGWQVPVVTWYVVISGLWQPEARLLLLGGLVCWAFSAYRRPLRWILLLLSAGEELGGVVVSVFALALSNARLSIPRYDVAACVDRVVCCVGEWLARDRGEIELRAVLACAVIALLGWPSPAIVCAGAVCAACCGVLVRANSVQRIGTYCALSVCTTTCMGLECAFDVMITQIAVDGLGLLYLVRAEWGAQSGNPSVRWADLAISVLFGTLIYLRLGLVQRWPLPAVGDTVNTIVSDKRGLDTLAEVCVFALAGCCAGRYVRPAFPAPELWALRPLQIYGLAYVLLFLLRECLGDWAGLGHSGGFAAGVVFGLVCASGLWRMSWDTMVGAGACGVALLGLLTQWSEWPAWRPWLFECGIACVVAGVVYALASCLRTHSANQNDVQ